jgi:hypothetical protein
MWSAGPLAALAGLTVFWCGVRRAAQPAGLTLESATATDRRRHASNQAPLRFEIPSAALTVC